MTPSTCAHKAEPLKRWTTAISGRSVHAGGASRIGALVRRQERQLLRARSRGWSTRERGVDELSALEPGWLRRSLRWNRRPRQQVVTLGVQLGKVRAPNAERRAHGGSPEEVGPTRQTHVDRVSETLEGMAGRRWLRQAATQTTSSKWGLWKEDSP